MLSIIDIDQYLFHLINTGMTNDIFDVILPLVREKLFWIPVYLFIISFVIMNFEKKGLYLVLFMFASFGVSDTISSKIVKPTVQRIRPCNDASLYHIMTHRVHCGSGYSFTSSHATNHFALSFFLISTIGFISNKLKILLFLWAAVVSFAQVYVGVHYPIDILGGSILGILVGSIMGRIFNRYITLDTIADHHPPPEIA